MELGFYSAAALLTAQGVQHEAVTRSITEGAKAGSKQSMASVTATSSGQMSLPGSFDSILQGSLPKAETTINFEPGAIRHTGNPYNIANSGKGFFEISLGGGQTLYTRNGEFHVSPERQLVDGYGRPVMGTDGPIQLLPDGGDFYCDRMGQLFQGSQKIGKLAVVEVPTKSLMAAAGGFIINPDIGGTATPVDNPSVMQGAREEGNFSTVAGMIELIGISRQQEVAQQILRAHDDRASQTIRTFGGLA